MWLFCCSVLLILNIQDVPPTRKCGHGLVDGDIGGGHKGLSINNVSVKGGGGQPNSNIGLKGEEEGFGSDSNIC